MPRDRSERAAQRLDRRRAAREVPAALEGAAKLIDDLAELPVGVTDRADEAYATADALRRLRRRL